MHHRDHPPAPIRRTPGKGFADYTVTQRLPKILSNAQETLADSGNGATAQKLLQAILAGDPIDRTLFCRPTSYWERYLQTLDQRTWADLPFFDLEFLFYHGLNSIAGYFDRGIDVFRRIRQGALAEAIHSLDAGLDAIGALPEAERLGAAIRYSLFANEADYSQMETSRGDTHLWDNRLLVDQADEFIARLPRRCQGAAAMHLIADNAGHELCWDLIKIDAMLTLFDGLRVVLHVKPWPMFVSDALEVDVEETLQRFVDSTSDNLQAIGRRLQVALGKGQISLQAETDWGEPRHFDALEDSLEAALRDAAGVIAKGDLNYRRFVHDRQWPADTPVAKATASIPFRALALRVLKSEATVGIDPAVVKQAAAERRDWQVCGHFAVVQMM